MQIKGEVLNNIGNILGCGLVKENISYVHCVKITAKFIEIVNDYNLIKVPFESKFIGCIKSDSFINTLKILPFDSIFSVIGSDNKIEIKNSQINVEFNKVRDVEENKERLKAERIKCNFGDILNGVKQAIPFVGTRESLIELQGISIKNDIVTASDNIRIVRADLKEKVDFDIVIPLEGAKNLLQIAENRGIKDIYKSGNKLVIEFIDGIELELFLFNVSYPDFEDVFKIIDDLKITVNITSDIIDGVSRLCAYQNNELRGMSLIVEDNFLRIESYDKKYVEKFTVKNKNFKAIVTSILFLDVCKRSSKMLYDDDVLYFIGDGVKFAMTQMVE